jgi:hypothetical protein
MCLIAFASESPPSLERLVLSLLMTVGDGDAAGAAAYLGKVRDKGFEECAVFTVKYGLTIKTATAY